MTVRSCVLARSLALSCVHAAVNVDDGDGDGGDGDSRRVRACARIVHA